MSLVDRVLYRYRSTGYVCPCQPEDLQYKDGGKHDGDRSGVPHDYRREVGGR